MSSGKSVDLVRLSLQSLATVANRHFERLANQLLVVGVLVFVYYMQLERVSLSKGYVLH